MKRVFILFICTFFIINGSFALQRHYQQSQFLQQEISVSDYKIVIACVHQYPEIKSLVSKMFEESENKLTNAQFSIILSTVIKLHEKELKKSNNEIDI